MILLPFPLLRKCALFQPPLLLLRTYCSLCSLLTEEGQRLHVVIFVSIVQGSYAGGPVSVYLVLCKQDYIPFGQRDFYYFVLNHYIIKPTQD